MIDILLSISIVLQKRDGEFGLQGGCRGYWLEGKTKLRREHEYDEPGLPCYHYRQFRLRSFGGQLVVECYRGPRRSSRRLIFPVRKSAWTREGSFLQQP